MHPPEAPAPPPLSLLSSLPLFAHHLGKSAHTSLCLFVRRKGLSYPAVKKNESVSTFWLFA